MLLKSLLIAASLLAEKGRLLLLLVFVFDHVLLVLIEHSLKILLVLSVLLIAGCWGVWHHLGSGYMLMLLLSSAYASAVKRWWMARQELPHSLRWCGTHLVMSGSLVKAFAYLRMLLLSRPMKKIKLSHLEIRNLDAGQQDNLSCQVYEIRFYAYRYMKINWGVTCCYERIC